MRFFTPWYSGLAQDSEAIDYIARSSLISGIELNHHENDDLMTFEEKGIPTIFHTPGHKLVGNLAAKNFQTQLFTDEFLRVMHIAKQSSVHLMAFHLGYSTSEVYKMRGHPNIPAKGAKIYEDRQELMDTIVKNSKELIGRFSKTMGADITYLFEGLDSSDPIMINWEIQSNLAILNKKQIDKFINANNINAALKYVTDPEFIREFIDRIQLECKSNVGVLLDVAHTWISATSFANRHKSSPENRFDDYIELLSEDIKQIHINRPGGEGRKFLTDAHQLLTGDAQDSVSYDIFSCWKKIKKKIDDSVVVTIEVAKPRNMGSLPFIKEVERQIISLQDA